jgi:hypothetical protein
MNFLQPYKGKTTRHTCPACQTKHSFTLYLNGNTHEPINSKVGKCNREIKCGYHYTPKQYYADYQTTDYRRDVMHSVSKFKIIKPPCPIGTLSIHFVEQSLSPHSNLVSFLQNHFSDEQVEKVFENYLLGATKNKEVIFWQIDIHGKVRTGKIMQYNPTTGKRLKHKSRAIDWVHNKLKKSGELPEDFNLQQCFFGEHLLKIYPDKQVAIVESEKSAVISSCIMPELVWLAAGNLNGLSIEKCQVLNGRDVILYPDLGAYEKWSLKVIEIQKQCNFKVSISDLLESEACQFDLENGLDIADYIIHDLI